MSLTNLFTSSLTNLISKTQMRKTLDWLIKVFTAHGRTLNLHTTTINLKLHPQLAMMNLICLMALTQSLNSRLL